MCVFLIFLQIIVHSDRCWRVLEKFSPDFYYNWNLNCYLSLITRILYRISSSNIPNTHTYTQGANHKLASQKKTNRNEAATTAEKKNVICCLEQLSKTQFKYLLRCWAHQTEFLYNLLPLFIAFQEPRPWARSTQTLSHHSPVSRSSSVCSILFFSLLGFALCYLRLYLSFHFSLSCCLCRWE